MSALNYYIVQDRWCWCGAAAAFVIVTNKRKPEGLDQASAEASTVMEYTCSIPHGQVSIDRLKKNEVKA